MRIAVALAITIRFVWGFDCPYESFTWVSHENDNPYFWKSPSFDWNATSTLALFGTITDSPERIEMRDYAQSIGVNVVSAVSPSDIDMTNETQRQEWVQQKIDFAIAQGLNGLNIDYEGHKPTLTAGFNDAVVELCEAFHKAVPAGKISIDVPIYPEYEGRNYDYARIAESCDSLFIMAYDGEFWDNVQCAVTAVNCSLACAPLAAVEYGLQKYLELGVAKSSLFLGLPWYGLKYEYVAHIPFFTGQIDYQDILEVIAGAGNHGKLVLDEKSSTWVFDCGGRCSRWSSKITDRTQEIWFDDPQSLAPKYNLATKYGIKGVGMWEATKVIYNPEERTPDADAMWNSLCQRN